MKKILLLCAIVSTITLFSCNKEKVITPKGTITITSPNGGETYHTGEYITVTWKSDHLPVGSIVLARIENTIPLYGTYGYYLLPQNEQGVVLFNKDVPTTANDGTEVFQIPVYVSDIYRYTDPSGNQNYSYGTGFKINLIVVYPANGEWTTVDQNVGTFETVSKNFFTIIPTYPDGCTSSVGYSTTNGQPCNVPSH